MEAVTDGLYHAIWNTYDTRFWARIWLFLVVESALLIAALAQGWDSLTGRVFLLLAVLFMATTITLGSRLTRVHLKDREAMKAEFDGLDSDADGQLTRSQVEEFVARFPPGTFKKFEAAERTSFPKLCLARILERRWLWFTLCEFMGNYLSFFASLILYRGGQSDDFLFIAQGIVSVIDLTIVFHSALDTYLEKYKTDSKCIRIILAILYWYTIYSVLVLFASGFALSTLLGEALSQSNIVTEETSGIPALEMPGFFLGWILTLFLVSSVFTVLIVYCCCACGGCIHVESSGGKIRGLGRENDVEGNRNTHAVGPAFN